MFPLKQLTQEQVAQVQQQIQTSNQFQNNLQASFVECLARSKCQTMYVIAYSSCKSIGPLQLQDCRRF